MKRSVSVRRSLLALSATAALFTGACSGSEKLGPNPPELQTAFDDAVAYWQQQRADLGKVSLKTIVEGGISCGYGEVITSDSNSPLTHCGGIGSGEIIVSKRSYDGRRYAQRLGISPRAVGVAAIGHEMGHRLMTNNAAAPEDYKKNELTADCLAGVYTRGVSPELQGEVRVFMNDIGGNGSHGTEKERTDAFDAGFTKGLGGCAAVSYASFGMPSPPAPPAG